MIGLSFGRYAEPGLVVGDCAQCEGCWIPAQDYWKWLELPASKLPPRELAAPARGHDTGPTKRCPDCGYFLEHHRVGHGLSFYLDHCGYCGGFWFDAGEWEMLRSKDLHRQVHKVFSQAWQAELACQHRAEAHEQILRSKLGNADYNEAIRIRDWLQLHRHRSEIYQLILPQQ
jgi:Zn-finger nucleic acid-binding protein